VVNSYSIYQVGVVSSPLWRLQDIEETGGLIRMFNRNCKPKNFLYLVM